MSLILNTMKKIWWR